MSAPFLGTEMERKLLIAYSSTQRTRHLVGRTLLELGGRCVSHLGNMLEALLFHLVSLLIQCGGLRSPFESKGNDSRHVKIFKTVKSKTIALKTPSPDCNNQKLFFFASVRKYNYLVSKLSFSKHYDNFICLVIFYFIWAKMVP